MLAETGEQVETVLLAPQAALEVLLALPNRPVQQEIREIRDVQQLFFALPSPEEREELVVMRALMALMEIPELLDCPLLSLLEPIAPGALEDPLTGEQVAPEITKRPAHVQNFLLL